jgi:predicted RNA-binding protein YlqC (UPF0109 family)
MKHIVNNPEVIKIDKEPEVEETKETEVNDDVLLMKHIVNNPEVL